MQVEVLVDLPAHGSIYTHDQQANVRVSGTCAVLYDYDFVWRLDDTVEVTLTRQGAGTETRQVPINANPWTEFAITTSGEYSVRVTARARRTGETKKGVGYSAFSVRIEPPPTIAVTRPAENQEIADTPGTFNIEGAYSGTSPIQVTVRLNGQDRTASLIDATRWELKDVPAGALGAHSIRATVSDAYARTAKVNRAYRVKDVTPPTVVIDTPVAGDRVWKADIRCKGKVTDQTSPIQGVQWSWQANGQFQAAALGADGASWEVRPIATTTGPVTIYVRAADNAGNVSAAVKRSFVLVEEVKPADRSDVTSRQTFLGDLLAYVGEKLVRHVGASRVALDSAQLESLFFQSFGQLSQQSPKLSLALESELRLVTGTVYRYADPVANAEILRPVRRRYVLAAYRALLLAIGTSLEELRTTLQGSAAQREALAARLGFPLSSGPEPDTIARLLLADTNDSNIPAARRLTEEGLNALFGYVAVSTPIPDPGTPGDALSTSVPSTSVASTPTTKTSLVTMWRVAKLALASIAEDNDPQRAPLEALVLDPDIVCVNDLALGTENVRRLLDERSRRLDAVDNERRDSIVATTGWPAAKPEALLGRIAGFVALSPHQADRAAAVALGLVDEANVGNPLVVLTNAIAWLREGRTDDFVHRLLQVDSGGLQAILALVDAAPTDRPSLLAPAVDALVVHKKRVELAALWKAEEASLSLSISPDLFVPPPSDPSLVPGISSTGLDAERRPRDVGQAESNWTISAGGTAVQAEVVAEQADWEPNDDRSRWIGVSSATNATSFDFAKSFSLRGFDPATVRMTIRVATWPSLAGARLTTGPSDDQGGTEFIPLSRVKPKPMFVCTLDDELGADMNTLAFSVARPPTVTAPAALRVEVDVVGVRSARAAIHRRGSLSRRIAWEEKLVARDAERRSIPESLAAACNLTDSITLPVLRDDLVRVAGNGSDEPSRGLTGRLLVDVMVGPQRTSSPTEMACRMLQTLLQLVAAKAPLPSAEIKLRTDGDADIAKDVPVLQSFDMWRGASLAFWYPENLLFPTLVAKLATATDPFKQWISECVMKGSETDPATASSLALEKLFAVNVQIALNRHAKGKYADALRRLARIYNYNSSDPKSGSATAYAWSYLREEEAIDSVYRREARWFSEDLNPHTLVRERRNAYTRFLLMTIGRIMLDAGDAAQLEDSDTAVDKARIYYQDAKRLLDDVPPPAKPNASTFIPDNPALVSLRARAAVALQRLRDSIDIGGLASTNRENLEVGVADFGDDGALRVVTSLPPPPTPYRFATLIERTKYLTSAAQQVESLYLAALKDKDLEAFTALKAQQEIAIVAAQQKVVAARTAEATATKDLTVTRGKKLLTAHAHYNKLLSDGVSASERAQMFELRASAELQDTAAKLSGAAAVVSFVNAAHPWANFLSLGSSGLSSLSSGLGSLSGSFSSAAGVKGTLASIAGLKASYERRREDWAFQAQMAQADIGANLAEVAVAERHIDVAKAEAAVVDVQAANATATMVFLATKFTGFPLYDYMARVLADAYRSLLAVATSTAHLAERQLAFERQEPPRRTIRSTYWETRDTSTAAVVGQTGDDDFRGLTGSARLMQDVTKLDQRAFETLKRKLQLRRSLSLARLYPAEFRQFRETGVLPFTTPMELFDRDFPGHYLRLLSSVKLSIAALVPPIEGVRGSLYCPGVSRVTVQKDGFRSLVQRRLPETVAFTSPTQTAGLFDVDMQPELLRPFEGLGVDTSWILELPRAANPFDYDTLIDVVLTLEYTALFDPGYRLEVIRRLGRHVQAERTFSIRSSFPHAWYALQSDDAAEGPTLSFDLAKADFPPNHAGPLVSAFTLYAVPDASNEGGAVELDFTSLKLETRDGVQLLGGARTYGGVVGTRRGSGTAWQALEGRAPIGAWTLALPTASRQALRRLSDIFVAVSYRATLPEWPR